MNAWDELPNAAHIDEVIAIAKRAGTLDVAREAAWDAAREAARDAARDAAREATREATRDAARDAAWDAAREAAWDVAREAAWTAAWDTDWDAAWKAAWKAAREALIALVAWDYAGDLFKADLAVVEMVAHSDDPAAILMLPIKQLMEKNGETDRAS